MESSALRAMRSKTRPEDAGAARLSRPQKRALYAVSALLWLSGAWWLYLSRFGSERRRVHLARAARNPRRRGDGLPARLRSAAHRSPPEGLASEARATLRPLARHSLRDLDRHRLGPLLLRPRGATQPRRAAVHSVLGILLPCAMGVHVWRARRHRARLGLLQARDRDSSYATDAPAVASSAGR